MARNTEDTEFAVIDGVSISYPKYLSPEERAEYFEQVRTEIANNEEIQNRLTRIREQQAKMAERLKQSRIQGAIDLLVNEGYTVTPA